MSSPADKRILVADDESSICEICHRVLGERGFQVDCSPDGREAWRRLNETDYALVILDIRMPLTSGRDVLKLIGQDRPDLLSRVILTSGDLMNEATTEFIRDTGRPFLPKPFTPDDLIEAVEALHRSLYTD